MSDDFEIPTADEKLQNALIQFTGCVGAAVDICSYGLTIGESYVPFDPDEDDECDDDEVMCSQLWVRVVDVQPMQGLIEGWEGDSCGLGLSMNLEVGILRCIEIPDRGEAPTATDVMAASFQALADMRAILCAAMGCEAWDRLGVGQWNPAGPLGGQYGGIWTFTVDL